MNSTNPITIELLMHERVADRLHEADHGRLVAAAHRRSIPSHATTPIAAMALAFARLAGGLF